MSDKNTVEILEAVHEVSERVARLETKLDEYNNLRDVAYSTKQLAYSNSEKIADIQESKKWSWRAIATTAISLAAKLVYDALGGK